MRMAARKLRVEDVAKLQALVVENFDAIEPGLTVLDARLLLGHGTIDVVGIDAAGSLVLCAVGFSANEEMLLKAVEAYSWCLEYPEGLVRLYPSCQLSEERPPRLLFVVERMPDAFQRKIKQLGFPEVDCVEFRHLEFDGVQTVYFESLLRLRRSRMVDADAPPTPPTPPSGAGSATENVITMNGASSRALSVKPPKHVTPASPDAALNGTRAADRVAPPREPAPVVSMVSRQATIPAPWVDRPRPAPEPVVLREPEPLIVAPVVETFTAAELEPDVVAAALELAIVPEPATEPVTLPELPEVPFPPFAVDAVPSMVPAHVATATTSFGERVSFKDLATALLGETTATQETLVQPNRAEPWAALEAVSEPIALEPIVVEPIVAPLELVLESSLVETIETPQPLVQSPALAEIVALTAATLPVEPVASVVESPKPPALTLETVGAVPVPAPAAREREVPEPAKPAAPPLPEGFEGLKFPNDGVLTRQWMEFLSQMSASK